MDPTTLLAILEDRGYRLTGPRRRVAEVVVGKADGFTAEELCSALPNVGRATVYRTLKLLVDATIICKLAMPDGEPRYTPSHAGYHHHHAVCVDCGAIQEFRDSTVERVVKAIGSDLEGQIVGHRIEFFIQCGKCGGRVS
ncbi:MAG: transcriptional repressor [Chloroflexi bacterium]|nr:transcriptional repressor [Chloroflexota bacterium]